MAWPRRWHSGACGSTCGSIGSRATQSRLRAELIGLKDSLREQIVELRRAIFALRPVQFDELGFVGGLHRYISEFAGQQGWEARIDLSQVPQALTPDLEALCFRIIQEALTNAAKHANAAHVEVTVDQVDGGLRVVVRDDGGGFEPGNVPASALGLRQMRERLGCAARPAHAALAPRRWNRAARLDPASRR